MNEPLNVLRMLALLAVGKMTPVDADKWSSETGEPLPYGRPAPVFYDPMGERYWSPLQGIAWIATRDVERVRDVSEGFRRWWTELRERDADAVDVADGPRCVWIRETIGPATFAETAANCREAHKARHELWLELEKGNIPASGFKGIAPDGLTQGANLTAITPVRERAPIPPYAWADLKFPGENSDPSQWRGSADEAVARACIRADDRYSDGPDRVRSDAGLVYTGVRIPRDEVLKIWRPNVPVSRPSRTPGRPGGIADKVEARMRIDAAAGYDLAGATQFELQKKYGTKSRNPVVAARKKILSENS